MQAGMAGGSTDCATFIICMNKLFNLKLTKKQMQEIGSSLGADVVPCFHSNKSKYKTKILYFSCKTKKSIWQYKGNV